MAKIKNTKSVNFYSKAFLEKNLKKFISSKENFYRINIHKSDNDIVHIMLMFYKRKFELPDGIYAIGLYVDSNKNEKLDTNFFGIPKEQFGFSNNAKGRFGPPSFESASFELDALKEISINLE